MKTLSIISGIFILLLLGCGENPVESMETANILKDKPPAEQSIKFSCELNDPENNVCILNGRVNYVYRVIGEAMTPRSETLIALRIDFSARLCSKRGMINSKWWIKGSSDEIVQVSEEGILLLEKCYFISNRNDVVLLMTYLLTTEGMGIARIELIPVEQCISRNLPVN